MRKILLCLLLIMFSFGSFCQKQDLNLQASIAKEFEEICSYTEKQNFNLQGAWKLVVYQETEESRVVTYFPGIYKGEQIKIWSGDRIIFVNRNTDGTNTNNWFGSGTFKLKGNEYEEFYSIHCLTHLENKVLRLKVEMKNDTLIQTYFLNEKFEMDVKSTHIEKYLKIN